MVLHFGHGMAWYKVRPGKAWGASYIVWPGGPRMLYGMVLRATMVYGMAWQAWRGIYNMVWQSMAWWAPHGMWFGLMGMAWHGMAWRGWHWKRYGLVGMASYMV